MAAPPSVRGRCRWFTGLVVWHAIPGALTWGAIGLGLGSIGASRAALAVAAVYAVPFGLSETLGLRLRVPTSRWQVPAHWVAGPNALRRVAVWGVTLGPGLVTRNPYAGMWMILPLLAAVGNPTAGLEAGVAVGLLHGAMRASGIAHIAVAWRGNVHRALMAYFGWRLIDGVMLLGVGVYIGVGLVAG